MNCNVWSNEFNPFQKWKILAWADRMNSILAGNFQAPVNIALDLLQGTKDLKLCAGHRCNFCMSDLEDEGSVARIPEDVLQTMPRFFHDWGVKSLCLAGHNSDTLIYRHEALIDFLRACQHWSIEVGLVTNGVAFTPMLIEEVARTCNWTGFSVNAGSAATYALITGSDESHYIRVIDTIQKIRSYCQDRRLKHDIGFKFLITDDNYREIFLAAQVARAAGARHFQVRPCELPPERASLIDIDFVDDQLRRALSLELPGVFEIFGIREKFTPDLKRMPPKACVASPLGSTWKADGSVVICPDRRWSAHQPDMCMGNYLTEGLQAIRRKWGGPEHLAMIKAANARLGECIRCTSYQWHNIMDRAIQNDDLDITLI